MFLDRYVTRKQRRPKARSLVELSRALGLKREGDAWTTMPAGLVRKWGSRKVDSITKGDVILHLDAMMARGVTVAANRTLAALHLFFAWCERRELVPANPCARVDRPAAEKPRTRVLSDDELRLFWRATAVERIFGPMFRLLALTGQRRDEGRAMTWSEVDLNERTWTIPAERTKNGREHAVPLSDAACDLLRKTRRIAGKRGLVFSTNGKTPLSGLSRAKRRLDASMITLAREVDANAKIDPWVLHDLRRTCATGMARLGIALPVIEKVLNHAIGSFAGIVSVYQHHTYAEEKRNALDVWANFMLALERPADNVVQLRKIWNVPTKAILVINDLPARGGRTKVQPQSR